MKFNIKNIVLGAFLTIMILGGIGTVASVFYFNENGITTASGLVLKIFGGYDCVVDANGAGDSSTLSGCLSSAKSVYVMSGKYYQSSQITVPSNTSITFSKNAWIYGNFTGDAAVLKLTGDHNEISGMNCDLLDKGQRCIWIYQATDWNVHDVFMRGDYAPASPNRVFFHIQGSDGLFSSIRIEGYDSLATGNYTGLGIAITNYVSNVKGSHLDIENTDDSCISTGGGLANAVSDLTINDMSCLGTTSQGGYGIDLFGAIEDSTFSDIRVRGKNNTCIILQTSGSYWPDNVHISDVYCQDIQNEGLHVKINNTHGNAVFSNIFLNNIGLNGKAGVDCVEHEYGNNVTFDVECVNFHGGGQVFNMKYQYRNNAPWKLNGNYYLDTLNATSIFQDGHAVLDDSSSITASGVVCTGCVGETDVLDYTTELQVDKSAVLGSAALEAYGEYANIKLPDAANSQVFGTIVIPRTVQTVNGIYFYVFGEGTGNVSQKTEVTAAAEGESVNTHRDTNSFTPYEILTSSKIYRIEYTEAFLSNLAAGDVVGIEFYREGGGATDDLAADLDLIAITLNVTLKQ